MRKVRLMELLKEPFRKPSPLEVIASELADAHMILNSQETNDAYINRSNGLEPDVLDDFAASIKGLIALIVVVTGITLLAFTIWGK